MELVATLKTLLQASADLGTQAWSIWVAGGWAMPPIAAVAMVMFGVGMRVHTNLRATGGTAVPERTWRSWIHHPEQRRGARGALLDQTLETGSLPQTLAAFQHLHATQAAPFMRDLRVMKVCVAAAPLMGLLGTVTGMLATFGALAQGSGGEQTMGLVAAGISEALITTETGLVVALPGLFLQHHLARRHAAYQAFLAHLESVCTQEVYRMQGRRQGADNQRAARVHIARALLRTLKPEACHG